LEESPAAVSCVGNTAPHTSFPEAETFLGRPGNDHGEPALVRVGRFTPGDARQIHAPPSQREEPTMPHGNVPRRRSDMFYVCSAVLIPTGMIVALFLVST
jgi:hypothetical protein